MLALSRRIFSVYDKARVKFFNEVEALLIQVDELNPRMVCAVER